jgi:hypothetical protein
MGWIVAEWVARAWITLGLFHALEWPRFLELHNLQFRVSDDLPDAIPALLICRTIIVRAGLDDWTTAGFVWHEAGHHLLHCGNQWDWREMACGELILAKQERQAEEFARFFPDWSSY